MGGRTGKKLNHKRDLFDYFSTIGLRHLSESRFLQATLGPDNYKRIQIFSRYSSIFPVCFKSVKIWDLRRSGSAQKTRPNEGSFSCGYSSLPFSPFPAVHIWFGVDTTKQGTKGGYSDPSIPKDSTDILLMASCWGGHERIFISNPGQVNSFVSLRWNRIV